MANEDSVLEETVDDLREAGQRIRATQHLSHALCPDNGENCRELVMRLSTAQEIRATSHTSSVFAKILLLHEQFFAPLK
jgi:hypothetical protein